MRTIIYDKDVNAISLTNPLPVVNGYDTTDSFSVTVTHPDATNPKVIRAATSGKSIYITDIVISTGTQLTIRLEDTDAVVEMNPVYFTANSSFEHNFSTPIQLTASKGLNYKASASGVVTITATGFIA